MAIRANQLTNFKGDPYVTETQLDAVEAALTTSINNINTSITSSIDDKFNTSGGDASIFDDNGNLKMEYNPTQILSMDNKTGLTGEDAGNDFDYNKLKFIGNCKVNYKGNGMIEIRIGDNLNCSLYNGKDGISTTTVSSTKKDTKSGTVSADYNAVSTADGNTSFDIFTASSNITANSGDNASTADGPTDGTNGNEVHFENNDKTMFIVYIKEGNNDDATQYVIGPITDNGTYHPKDASNNVISGITCVVKNFGEEPKAAKGATGYSGNVSFTIQPSLIYADSTAFKLEKIEMVQVTSKPDVTPVTYSQDAVWNNTSNATNGTYFYLKETTKPGTLVSVTYTVSTSIKQESGVTYLTTDSTMKPSGTDFCNVGYPAYVSNKVYCQPNADNAWFTAFYDTDVANFTTWTTVKDESMNWTYGLNRKLLAGTFNDPQVVLNGVNFNGSGSTVTSAKTDNKLWVHAGNTSGSNITDERYDATFSSKSNFATTDLSTAGNTDLQVYQGLLQYPSTDYSAYNKDAFDSGSNPDYSECSGDRYYYMKFNKSGSMPSGQLDVVATADITSALSGGDLQFQIAKDASMSKLYNVVFSYSGSNNIGGSNSTYGSSCALKYTFDDGAANNTIWLKITMRQGCGAKIKSVLLNGGSLA